MRRAILLTSAAILALAALLLPTFAAPQSTPWTNFNAIFDLICQAQGADVAPGSTDALRWGSPPYAGQTGGQPAYGYRHLHEIMMLTGQARVKAIRAIFASTMARHCAYYGPGAAYRSGGYEKAMRPFGWSPELPNDLDYGPTRWFYNGVPYDYTGLDEQHAWTFLFDATHFDDIVVPFLPGMPGLEMVNAADLARARLIFETAGMVGMSRQPWYMTTHPEEMEAWDRVYARLLQWPIQASYEGCLLPEDVQQVIDFTRVAVKFYSEPPGGGLTDKAVVGVPAGAKYWNPSFGAWAGAALYDAAKFVEASDPWLAAQARECSIRLGRWAAESLEGDILPWVVIFEPALAAGVGGQPVPSLTPYFANGLAKKVGAGIDAGAWAYRGIACAADLGDPVAAAAEGRLLDRWHGTLAYWSFLVNPDWSYAVPEARTLVGE